MGTDRWEIARIEKFGRVFLGTLVGLILGVILVGSTMFDAWTNELLFGIDVPPPIRLLPYVLLFTLTGTAAGYLSSLQSAWWRYPLIGALLGSCSGCFLGVSHPYVRPFWPQALQVPEAALVFGAAGAAAGLILVLLDVWRGRF